LIAAEDSEAEMKHAIWLLCPVLLLGTLGCGSQFATVEGIVTVDGKPANKGSVIFSGAGNRSAAGTIMPDGSYVAENVPVGEVRVSIMQMIGGPARPGPFKAPGSDDASPAAPAKPMPIPNKYKNVETSNLTYTVTSGANEIDIQLSSK
jgi:hypothetical protein